MRGSFSCSDCGRKLDDGDSVLIQTRGVIVEGHDGYAYVTERKAYVCSECQ